ncbi:hypothetical protein CDV31_006013 [Fusarium ambrosium]|uniref:Uncharacterized protein n=1 Tax=Fusarium ambrosium TaxID=131363 RepID=A0A428UFG6_9HYPO|nr:hypothetical protein CDV31_006013 [Fusarium ambrosium]
MGTAFKVMNEPMTVTTLSNQITPHSQKIGYTEDLANERMISCDPSYPTLGLADGLQNYK